MTPKSSVAIVSTLAAETRGVFRGRDVVKLGVTRKQLRALVAGGVVDTELPDTYRMSAVARNHEQTLQAALLWAGADAAACIRSWSSSIGRATGPRR